MPAKITRPLPCPLPTPCQIGLITLSLITLSATTVDSFLCGVGQLPVGLAVSDQSVPFLLCAKSNCLVQSPDLGYANMDCGKELIPRCSPLTDFVLAFGKPSGNSTNMSQLCCRHPSLAVARQSQVIIVHPGQSLSVGGPILNANGSETGFTVANNIARIPSNDGTSAAYQVTFAQVNCRVVTVPEEEGPTEAQIAQRLADLHKEKNPQSVSLGVMPILDKIKKLPQEQALTELRRVFRVEQSNNSTTTTTNSQSSTRT